jgi:hypothetical protein
MMDGGRKLYLTIRYTNGITKESVLLSRTKELLRVAIEGGDDVTELRLLNGIWVTEDCEPVQVTFAWEREPAPEVTEAECICPPDVAARLLHLLFVEEESLPEAPPALSAAPEAVSHLII